MEAPPENERVCVTGASGFLGSWLVMRLLQRGYSVRGTVRRLDKSKTRHLLSLPESKEKLVLVEADLLDESTLLDAVKGCDRVFAVGVPLLDHSEDQTRMIDLVMTATMNLLRACSKSQCVKKVVLTSTYYSAIQVPREQGHTPFEIDESWWTSVEYCIEQKMLHWGYMVSKTLAEKAAFEYAKENNLDLISILPSLVGGPFLTPSIPGSISAFLAFMTDVPDWMRPLLGYMSYVHVDDAIRAHILLMEDSRAKGRYLCSAVDATFDDVLHEVLPLLKSHNIKPPNLIVSSDDEDITKAYYKINTNKLKDMGFSYEFDTLNKIFKETMLFFLEKGHLKQ